MEDARVKPLTEGMSDSAGKVVVILNKAKYGKEIPDYLAKRDDLEFYGYRQHKR